MILPSKLLDSLDRLEALGDTFGADMSRITLFSPFVHFPDSLSFTFVPEPIIFLWIDMDDRVVG